VQAPVRIWSIDDGTAHGLRMDVGETVEFDLIPGDTQPLSEVTPGGHSQPLMVDIRRLRPWSPSWGQPGPGAA